MKIQFFFTFIFFFLGGGSKQEGGRVGGWGVRVDGNGELKLL